jgi:hypothetical protein
MRNIIIALFAVLFTAAATAQNINFTYQGWSNQSGKNRLSLYIARDGFKLNSAFNDQNYPVWYVENQEIDIVSGVINYTISNVNVDSLENNVGQLFLYVSVNGTPHDTIPMDPSPYSGYSILSGRSLTSDFSTLSDSSRNSGFSDSSRASFRSTVSDSSLWANRSYNSVESVVSQESDSAIVSESTWNVLPNGVDLLSIAASGAEEGAVLSITGNSLQWTSQTKLQGKTQLTLVPLSRINDDVRTLIYRVAQDIISPLPAATEGRIVTIVNSSTANTVTVQSTVLNVWGGDVIISPRRSATLLYTGGEWIVVSQ